MSNTSYIPGTGPVKVHEVSRGAILARATNLLGAVVSLGLIVGVSVWGYKLVMRDVTGLPVVRAIEGPMREQPKNPGGRPADHQGFAVNTVAASGAAAPTADRLMLAPAPVDLTAEDTPVSTEAATPEVEETDTARPVSEAALAAFRQGAVDAIVAELTQNVEPIEGTEAASADEPAIDPADLKPRQPVITNASVPQSLRPVARPAKFVRAVAKPAPSEPAEVEAEDLPAGARLAQLGAYETDEIARQEWDRLVPRFGDYMDGKSRVIQEATSGGRTFYRLRAVGFEDLSDARRFCAALVAEGADCIPVTAR